MAEKEIVWFGMKLSPEQKRKIESLARRRGLSQKEAVMDVIEAALSAESRHPEEASFLDRYAKYCGAVDGPGDLNTNRGKYMRDYGRSRGKFT